jgi:hypothetical protein
LRGLATAEVAQGPGSVPEHAQLAAVSKKCEKWAKGASLENEVAACGAITGNVSESPDSLFPDIWLVAAEELDEDGHGARLNDDLGLQGRTRGDVGEGPGSLELHQSVRRPQELDKPADDASLDYSLNRRVSLLGQELAELGRCLNLLVDLL